MDVTILGDITHEFFAYSNALPMVGERVVGTAFQSALGGTGVNQATAISKLGGQVSLIATVGEDEFGSSCIEALEKAGIPTGTIRQTSVTETGIAMIMVNKKTGENQIVVVLGANSEVSIHDVDNADTRGLFSTKLFSCQFESNAMTSLYALEKAHSNGVITLLDPAPGPTPGSPFYHLLPRFLAAATVVSPNENEAASLTGIPIPAFTNNASSMEVVQGTSSALLMLLKTGVKYPIITLGQHGAAAILPASEINQPLPADVYMSSREMPPNFAVLHIKTQTFHEAIDSTGAGDCFTGSLAFFMSNYPELTMVEKIRRSVWIATQSVMRCGTKSSYLDRKELPTSLFHKTEYFKWPDTPWPVQPLTDF